MTHHDENYDEWIEQEIDRADALRDEARDESMLAGIEEERDK